MESSGKEVSDGGGGDGCGGGAGGFGEYGLLTTKLVEELLPELIVRENPHPCAIQ